MAFKGFSSDMFIYLRNVVLNDSKKWYEEHKPDYNKLIKEPFYELIGGLTPLMRSVDEQILTEPKRCLSRIYRDARYSKGKSMYRDHVWICFCRQGNSQADVPSFYFEIAPNGCACGMGFYCSSAKTMGNYRAYIAENPKTFAEAVSPIEKHPLLRPEGGCYTRGKPDCPAGLEKWYNFKTFYINANLPSSFIERDDILSFLSEIFTVCVPLYKILAYEIPENKANSYNTDYNILF